MDQRLPIQFCGTGAYAPKEIITNEYFAGYLDTSDEWIVARTGIKTRHRAAPDETTSTMATEAAKLALEDAGLSIEDIDLIICATATGDHPFPATAALIQNRLGAKDTPAYDVQSACAGFLFGTLTASAYIASGMFNRVLLCGAETLTRFADPEDRSTIVLFGDAAGAAILSRAQREDQGILYWDMGTDGARSELIWVPAGGSRLPASETTVAERLHFMKMKGREVYKFAVKKLEVLIDRALEQTGIKADDLAMLIPHQSNLRIIESARRRLGLPREKIAINIDRYGNTSAASVIISLDEARRSGRLKEGDLVLLVAIGAGISWSTMIVRL